MMDSYNIDDLKGLISLMTLENVETVSKIDMLEQLNCLREIREASNVVKNDSVPFSPEFTFKQPAKTLLSENVDLRDTTRNAESVKAATSKIKDDSFQVNEGQSTLNFAVGNKQTNDPAKKYGRPRRGATPHKSPTLQQKQNSSADSFTVLHAKENREPNKFSQFLYFSPEKSVQSTIQSNAPNFATASANVSVPAVPQDKDSPSTAIPVSFSIGAPIDAVTSGVANVSIGQSMDTRSGTPQSVNSEMSMDNSAEDVQESSPNGTDASTFNFQPKCLNSKFKPVAAFFPAQSGAEVGLFNIGIHKTPAGPHRKKKEKPLSPDSTWIDKTFAPVTPGRVAQDGKLDTSFNVSNDNGHVQVKAGMSPFSSWWGGVGHAGSDNRQQDETITRLVEECSISEGGKGVAGSPISAANAPSTAPKSTASPITSAPFLFNVKPVANLAPIFVEDTPLKTARPPSPKKSPHSAYRRMKINVNATKSPGITGKQSSSDCDDAHVHTLCSEVSSMDIDFSPPPSMPVSQPSVLPAKPPSLPTASTVQEPTTAWGAFTPKKVGPFTSSVPAPAPATPLNEKSGSESDSDDMDVSSSTIPMSNGKGKGKAFLRTTKEACAPMTALKGDKTPSKWASEPNSLLPDESAERMNDLANQYRKQGGDLYSREQYEQALDSFEKSLKFGAPSWTNRSTVLGNRAATLMMLGRLFQYDTVYLTISHTKYKDHITPLVSCYYTTHIRYIEAADDCAKAVQVDSNMVKLHSRRGRALMRLGRFTEANEAFTLLLDATAPYLHDLEAAKVDARNGMKTLNSARIAMKRLAQLEAAGDYLSVLALLEDLSAQCPSCSVVHTSKCNVLCKLQKWGDAKACAEEFVCSAHISIQNLTAHPKTSLPCPITSRLRWIEKEGSSTVSVEVTAVVQAVLCMGPDLAKPYITALKNIQGCPNSCADAMLHVLVILTELSHVVCDPPNPAWMWVFKELKNLKDASHYKDLGDKHFRASAFAEATVAYTRAIDADPTANKWCAILYNNRAAANMGQNRFAETVADCHQAISRDPSYARAYLRRARALGALKSYAAGIRDFRHYLASKPTPIDSVQASIELEGLVEAHKREVRSEQMRGTWDGRADEQRRAYGESKNIPKNWAGAKSQYAKATQAPKGGSNANTKTWSGTGQDSDDDSFFSKAAQQQKSKASANPKVPYPDRHNTWGRTRSAPQEESNDEDGCESKVQNGGQGCHYHTLGVDASSSERQIKVAYRKLALKYHPDKNKEPGAEDQFKSITSAYSVIIDKSTRDQYDRKSRTAYRKMW